MARVSKDCSNCFELKSLDSFYKCKTGRFGVEGQCKTCKLSKRKEWYKGYKERDLERSKAYYRANKKQILSRHKAWRESNIEKVLTDAKYHRDLHRDEINEYSRLHYENNKDYYTDKSKKRRAIKLKASIEEVNSNKVFNRDSWICQLCLEPVDPNLVHPDPRSKSLDHIVPLSKGGDHSYANTQLAHLVCNLSKGSRIMEE